ncbi:MAG: RNA-binding cell elongation regulator Jag/EloR [Candidatus Muiribacteriota bacterium]
MKKKFEGKTYEDAIKESMKHFGVGDRDLLEISIIEEETKGLFGFGGKNAVVEVGLKKPHIFYAKEYLIGFFDNMGIENYDIEVFDNNKELNINLKVPMELKRKLIGKFGKTLNSIEYLVRVYVNKKLSSEDNSKFIIYIDVENYRQEKLRKLEKLASQMAEKVIISGKSMEMNPMTARERKMIHMTFKNDPHISTFSKGQEPYRKIVLSAKKK